MASGKNSVISFSLNSSFSSGKAAARGNNKGAVPPSFTRLSSNPTSIVFLLRRITSFAVKLLYPKGSVMSRATVNTAKAIVAAIQTGPHAAAIANFVPTCVAATLAPCVAAVRPIAEAPAMTAVRPALVDNCIPSRTETMRAVSANAPPIMAIAKSGAICFNISVVDGIFGSINSQH